MNNPDLVYLDNAATVQKPASVIESVKDFLEHEYGNIHRGRYTLAEKSEQLFWSARQKVADRIGAHPEEIVFTANSTDASNLLVTSMMQSGWLHKGDTVLLSLIEHHASIVPRHMAAEKTWITLQFVPIDEKGCLTLDMFQKQYTPEIKIVVCSLVSNVTGQIIDIQAIKALLSPETVLIVDASQALPHMAVDVRTLGCDFLFFTGHKLWAFTGIGVLFGKKAHLRSLTPGRGGGSAIESVTTHGYTLQGIPDKFEPGTPNLVGVVSLLKALEYLEHVWGYTTLHTLEQPLVAYCLHQFDQFEKKWGLILLGPKQPEKRIGLFSFVLPEHLSSMQIGQRMATHNIAIRCGWQCAQPLHDSIDAARGSCRISLRLYTDMRDCTQFFEALEQCLTELQQVT